MRAEEIAAKQRLFLLDPCEHGVWPMQKRRVDKAQRLAADIDHIAVQGNLDLQIRTVRNIFQIDRTGF